MQPAILAGSHFLVGPLGLLKRQIASERNRAEQLWVEFLQPLEIETGESLGAKFSFLDPSRELSHRGKGNVFVIDCSRGFYDLGVGQSIREN